MQTFSPVHLVDFMRARLVWVHVNIKMILIYFDTFRLEFKISFKYKEDYHPALVKCSQSQDLRYKWRSEVLRAVHALLLHVSKKGGQHLYTISKELLLPYLGSPSLVRL